MRHTNDNVCKFVTTRSEGQINTTNFVFEKRATGSGRRQMRSVNVMYLAVSGTGRLITDDMEADLIPGTLFFTFAGKYFTIENTEGLTYMYISFNGTRARELFTRIDIAPDRCVFQDFEGLVSFWQNAIGRTSPKNLDLITESVLLYTFSQMALYDEQDEKAIINRVLHHIEMEFTSHSLSLTSCAEYLGYNPKYISRCFREQVGMTFSDYVKNTRVRHAVFLIEQGVSVVKNVALLSGFGDPLYFSNVFHKIVGMTPTAYIARQNADGETESAEDMITPASPDNTIPAYCSGQEFRR